MSDVVYTSRVRVERVKGPRRRAYLPVESEPIWFGVHSEVAEHYGVDTDIHQPHADFVRWLALSATASKLQQSWCWSQRQIKTDIF